MNKELFLSAAICAILSTNSASAEEGHSQHQGHSGHDAGYNESHFGEGHFMLTYEYEGMLMKGMKDGDSDIRPNEVTAAAGPYGYLVSPTRMTMEMHMFGAMYGISDDVTLMAMAHYMEKDMDLVNRAGAKLKTNSQGFGDTELSAMVKLAEDDSSLLYTNIGLSLPTGKTDFKGNRAGAFGNLPYAMQLGSGTFDPVFGLSYSTTQDNFTWGADADATIRLGRNDEGYTLGDEYELSLWGGYQVSEYAAFSARVDGKSLGGISGEDAGVAALAAAISTADPDNYGGKTVSLAAGVSLFGDEIGLQDHVLSLEYERPVYQNLDGPQLGVQHSIIANWQVVF